MDSSKWGYKNGVEELRRVENFGEGWEVSFYTPFGMLLAFGYLRPSLFIGTKAKKSTF